MLDLHQNDEYLLKRIKKSFFFEKVFDEKL